jgi:magnesium chelatase family protein
MALFKTRSAAVYGIDAHVIDVEVDMYSSGSARDSRMVGMPDVAVRESRERCQNFRPRGFSAHRYHVDFACRRRGGGTY